MTNARGGYSNHNFGVAFDNGVSERTKYLDELPKYKAVGALGSDLGLEWCGNWNTIQDEPHFQLRPSWAADLSERDMLAELRSRKPQAKLSTPDFALFHSVCTFRFVTRLASGKPTGEASGLSL